MLGSTPYGSAYLAQGIPTIPAHWGVDSTTRANAATATPDKTFFDLVKEARGKAPEFWGRYIGGRTQPDWELTVDEIQYLHLKNCKILIIYRGTEVGQVQTEAQGIENANRAKDFAAQLNLPIGKKICIYCNTEPEWFPTKDFFKGWFDTMQASDYLGGVYGNTGSADPNEPGNNFHTPFCEAYTAFLSVREGLLWTHRPRIPECDIPRDRPFTPRRPRPCNVAPVIWQYSADCPVPGANADQDVDLDLANSVGFEKMWAPQRWDTAIKVVGGLVDMSSFSAVRTVDVTAGGRIYLAWGDPNLAQYRIAYSEDNGATWTVPTGTAWLAETIFSVCALDDESLVVITRQGVGSSARFLYHYRWLNNAWSGATLVRSVASPNTISPPRTAHSRPVTSYSVLWREGNINATNNILYWAPLTTTGIGTAEPVDGNGTNRIAQQINSYALYYNEANEPVVLWIDTTVTPQGKKRIRSGGVWGAITQFDSADLTLLDAMMLQQADSDYSTGIRSNGDVHALRPQGTTLVFDYRHRIGGTWADEVVDLSPLITGLSDSSTRHRSSVPVLIGSRAMIAVYTVGSTQFAVWFAYREL